MAVSLLTSLIDSSAFVAGVTARGSKVVAEIAQLINKINEVIGLANTTESTVAANGIALTQLAVTDATHTSQISALDTRVDALEGGIGNAALGTVNDLLLTEEQYLSHRFLHAYAADVRIGLPHGVGTASLGFDPNPMTIIASIDADQIFVYIETNSPSGYWASGDPGDEYSYYLTLGPGESVTVYPVPDNTGQNIRWAIIAGQASYPTP